MDLQAPANIGIVRIRTRGQVKIEVCCGVCGVGVLGGGAEAWKPGVDEFGWGV